MEVLPAPSKEPLSTQRAHLEENRTSNNGHSSSEVGQRGRRQHSSARQFFRVSVAGNIRSGEDRSLLEVGGRGGRRRGRRGVARDRLERLLGRRLAATAAERGLTAVQRGLRRCDAYVSLGTYPHSPPRPRPRSGQSRDTPHSASSQSRVKRRSGEGGARAALCTWQTMT